ncbi:MAG TPA: CPBP family intramembrane glutamic endopeptidase [Acidobacteriaceae bacterium]
MSSAPAQIRVTRSLQVALFATGVLWLLAAHAVAVRAAEGIAGRITDRLGWGAAQSLLTEAFFLFLLLLGFTLLSWIGMRQGSVREANALPRRGTASREWATGAVIGWAVLLLAVLPMTLAGALLPQFSWSASAWGMMLLSALSLALGALANEVAFRGFIFRRLIEAIGPTAATLLLSGLYALLGSLRPNATGLSFLIALLAGVLFSLAYLRTHALWLGWGLHFAWAAATAIVFGLPVGGIATYSSLVQTDASGPAWLTGGAYGPEGALLTGVVFVVAMAAVYRATREYAWNYTHPPIVPAGYPMDVPPPTAHAAMEQEAAAKTAALVQIAPAARANAETATESSQPSESSEIAPRT